MIGLGEIINDRYQVIKKIGAGGMGDVWECKDLVLNRNVAIKTVREMFINEDASTIKILKDEANLGASLLGHPNIVIVLDFGEYKASNSIDSTYFIVMELVKGITLDKWISTNSKKYDRETVYNINLLIAWEICKAINYAHSKGVMHRDIKPLNIFLSEAGMAKIGDFGIGRFVEAITRTHTKWQANSPAYCSPEQWAGEKPDFDAEVYQVGCTLYQLFTGRLPFEAENLVGLMNAHLNNNPTPPKEINPDICDNISKCIMTALEKDKKKRAELWSINDTIARELIGSYELVVDVHDKPIEIHKAVNKITEFNLDGLEEGEFECIFPDFSEALSEGLQLVLAGIENVKIQRKVVDSQKVEKK